jgi:murein DD-endopeptidase MepM/ murein hydrolase activator NlpD
MTLVTRRGTCFRIRAWVAGLLAGGFALFSVAYLGATAYLIYRDDLLGGTLARQVGMQYAYEDRIAALRAELDRVTSRHVVQSRGIGEQLSLLLDRQAALTERQQNLEALAQAARRAGIDVEATLKRLPQTKPTASVPDAAQPLAYAPSAEKSADIISGLLLREAGMPPFSARSAAVQPLLSAVAASLDATEEQQHLSLDALGTAVDTDAQKISSALAPLGVKVPLAGGDPGRAPQGGPYLPIDRLHFVEKLSLLSRDLESLAALQRDTGFIPLGAPVRAAALSSRFGTRNDPFLNRPAFHAGLDFVAAEGTLVTAAAGGRVTSAEWAGGYGQMVEIAHLAGITTRYGHLSAILVSPGQRVSAGTPIGRVGSTGRSTGPHLHYETRRDGKPLDPALFLAAGRALSNS